MAKKPKTPGPEIETVVDEEILEAAKRALQSDRPVVAAKCVICSGDASPSSAEKLCWVCRRLKISAWRDVDPQISMTE